MRTRRAFVTLIAATLVCSVSIAIDTDRQIEVVEK